MQQAVSEASATRLVVDSLNGVEPALSPTVREDFRESLYRVVGHMSGGGVSVMLTIEVMESFEGIRFSPHAVSFMAQNVLFLRYVEIEGQLLRMLAVIKMRRSRHSTVMREFEVSSNGLVVLEPLTNYQGILRGVAERRPAALEDALTRAESALLQHLRSLRGGATLEQLVELTGQRSAEIKQRLNRLLELGYARPRVEQGRTVYEA